MSHVCRGPVWLAAAHSAWWNWNWITKLMKYLERGEDMGMNTTSGCAREEMPPPHSLVAPFQSGGASLALELHLPQLSPIWRCHFSFNVCFMIAWGDEPSSLGREKFPQIQPSPVKLFLTPSGWYHHLSQQPSNEVPSLASQPGILLLCPSSDSPAPALLAHLM